MDGVPPSETQAKGWPVTLPAVATKSLAGVTAVGVVTMTGLTGLPEPLTWSLATVVAFIVTTGRVVIPSCSLILSHTPLAMFGSQASRSFFEDPIPGILYSWLKCHVPGAPVPMMLESAC